MEEQALWPAPSSFLKLFVCLIAQEGYGALRGVTDTLYACFERIRGMFLLIASRSWDQFYELAIEGGT